MWPSLSLELVLSSSVVAVMVLGCLLSKSREILRANVEAYSFIHPESVMHLCVCVYSRARVCVHVIGVVVLKGAMCMLSNVLLMPCKSTLQLLISTLLLLYVVHLLKTSRKSRNSVSRY